MPLPPRSGNDQRCAGGDNDLLLNVQAGVLPEWLRPRMPMLDTDSETDMADKSGAPAAAAAASRSPTPPPANVKPHVNFIDSPARLDTPDLPDDMIDPVPAILSVDLAADTASPSSALQTLVDLALEDAQPTPGRVEYAPQDATFAGGALTMPPPTAASLPPRLHHG